MVTLDCGCGWSVSSSDVAVVIAATKEHNQTCPVRAAEAAGDTKGGAE